MQTNPEIFKRNMKALQQRYPDLALMLSLVKIEKYKLVQYENCMPNVVINNQPYYIGNIKDFCESQFKGFDINNVKVPVFCGFGLGYEVMYWMSALAEKHKSQAIIIFEKDPEMFMCAMNVTDLTKIINNPSIHLFVGLGIEQMYTTFRLFFKEKLKEMLMCGTMQPLFLYPAMKIGKQYYMRTMQILFESIYHSIQNFGNCPEDSLIGLENMLDNIKEIAENPGINMLHNKFKDKPAVIVATGPSLKKNMHLLKGIEDKALILSVDASFKLLMKNGIKPHMVTSLEREHDVRKFFDDFKKEDVEDVYMTACPVLYNHVYQSYNGPKIIVYRNFDHFKWLKIDKGILDIKLSSSNMAFKIAEALGCNPIILIGQDLAYGEDGSTHATEVPFTSEGEGIFDVKGNIKEKVKTNSGWYGFLKAYELDISQHKGKVINCTEGGAYIQGTYVANFDETIDKYINKNFNPLEIIKENLSEFKSNKEDTAKLKQIVEKTEKEVRTIIDNCIKGKDLIKKYKEDLENNISQEQFDKIRKEIIAPRLEIQTAYADTFQKFLMHVVQSYHLKFEMECAMLYTNTKKLLLRFDDWYSFIGDISEICLQSLEKAKDKLYEL
ncbi:MAG: motility associated factor glycosyltransferase family protein [Candidatus Odinarchaeota archaeon]